MLALGVEGLTPYIRTIGLFNSKARNIIATCRALVEQHAGAIPRTREALEALPGVGRKTANVVLNVAFGELTMAVDTHIFRVGNRTGIAPGKTERQVEDRLIKFIAPEFLQHAHHWLILHGRYVCKARTPDCPVCIINDLCEYRRKTRLAGLLTMFGSYTREQLRQTYSEAWQKQLAGTPLSPLEAMIADVIGLHPEYQRVVGDAEAAGALDSTTAAATENPFLHMGLHMAVREQVSIDRPPGIRELHGRLQARFGSLHDAEHVLMEALAETLWEAQRAGRAPDEQQYLSLARQRFTAGRP